MEALFGLSWELLPGGLHPTLPGTPSLSPHKSPQGCFSCTAVRGHFRGQDCGPLWREVSTALPTGASCRPKTFKMRLPRSLVRRDCSLRVLPGRTQQRRRGSLSQKSSRKKCALTSARLRMARQGQAGRRGADPTGAWANQTSPPQIEGTHVWPPAV